VRVINNSGVSLDEVIISELEGQHQLGTCQPGQVLSTKLRSFNDGFASISFKTSGDLHSKETGYVERSYCIDYVILPNFEVEERLQYLCMDIGRAL